MVPLRLNLYYLCLQLVLVSEADREHLQRLIQAQAANRNRARLRSAGRVPADHSPRDRQICQMCRQGDRLRPASGRRPAAAAASTCEAWARPGRNFLGRDGSEAGPEPGL